MESFIIPFDEITMHDLPHFEVRMRRNHLIQSAHAEGVNVGLCGQAPSDYPGFTAFLVQCGIDSISFNPDASVRGISNISRAEGALKHSTLF